MAILTGVFTDSDHVLDYIEPRDGHYLKYMTRPFHAWEYGFVGIAILITIWYHPLFLAATIGYISHLVLDQLGNETRPFAYFVTYRIFKKFKRRELTPHLFDRTYKRLEGPIPLWGKIETRLYRMYLRYRTGEPW